MCDFKNNGVYDIAIVKHSNITKLCLKKYYYLIYNLGCLTENIY